MCKLWPLQSPLTQGWRGGRGGQLWSLEPLRVSDTPLQGSLLSRECTWWGVPGIQSPLRFVSDYPTLVPIAQACMRMRVINYTLWLGACRVHKKYSATLQRSTSEAEKAIQVCRCASHSFVIARHRYLAGQAWNKRFYQETVR